eukprot:TRINITY_DN6826_c0_g1_i1.p2 TRINITY_DN6826_c0_g1~~TRINITY_DN6826_c0_g1_i1.p2  ORF type:complete len:175 (-),score=57.57 TRINITY_DN6826_c0_g1_i1:104-628(-)
MALNWDIRAENEREQRSNEELDRKYHRGGCGMRNMDWLKLVHAVQKDNRGLIYTQNQRAKAEAVFTEKQAYRMTDEEIKLKNDPCAPLRELLEKQEKEAAARRKQEKMREKELKRKLKKPQKPKAVAVAPADTEVKQEEPEEGQDEKVQREASPEPSPETALPEEPPAKQPRLE